MKTRIVVLGGEKLSALIQLQGGDAIEVRDITEQILTRESRVRRLYRYIRAIRDCDIVINMFVTNRSVLLARIAHFFRKPFVAYWIGTDVYNFLNKRSFSTRFFDANWAYAYSLKEELEPSVSPVEKITLYPLDMDYTLAKMPKEHAVMMYIPEGKEEFYNYELAVQLINAFPNLQFHIVANGKSELFSQQNVTAHGFISTEEMNELFNKISIVVRAPLHDGQSLSIMEGQLKGKYVIYNMLWPYTIRAQTSEDFQNEIGRLITKPPQVQIAAHDFAVQECDKGKARAKLLELIERACEVKNSKNSR